MIKRNLRRLPSILTLISTLLLTLLTPLTPLGLQLVATFVPFEAAFAAPAHIFKIVSSLPRTGSANSQSTSIVNGIKLAIDEVGGVIGDAKIVYEDFDDASPERGAWDPALEAANADKAINDPTVFAFIGPYNSGAAKISMPKTNSAGLLQVSPSVTWPGLTKPGIGEANEPAVYIPSGKRNFFRVVPADDIQGLVAAQWAKSLGLKTIYVLHDRELYGKGVAEIFRRSAPANGLSILDFEGIDPKASNYRSLATKIRQRRPDLVYFGGTTQTNAGQIAKDLRASGVTAKFMVPDGCFEQAFIQSAGADNLNGRTYITFGGVPPEQLTGPGKKFYDDYKAKFGTPPESYSIYGYEAGRVVVEGIKSAAAKASLASLTRASVIEAVAGNKDFSGALGRWSFDENGDTTLTTMSGNVVENGEFKFSQLLGAQ